MIESAFKSRESILYDDKICRKKNWKFQLTIYQRTQFLGYFSDTNMNLLFQRKCVNSAVDCVESIYSWVSQHLVTTWSKFGQPNYKYSQQRFSHIFSEKVHSYWYH